MKPVPNSLLTLTLLAWSVAAVQAAEPAVAGAATADWVARSNKDAEVLLEVYSRFTPEVAGRFGVAGIDTRIIDLGPALPERQRAAFTAAARDIEALRDQEKDARVRQDLEILIRDAQLQAAVVEAEQLYLLPNFDLGSIIYNGVRVLLTDQVPKERQAAAVDRLRRYAGLEEGYTPLAVQAEARIREQLPTIGLLFPFRGELEQQLANSNAYLDGVAELLKQYQVQGADKSLKELRAQLAAYDGFLRQEILPRAREDFRLPPELYAVRLREFGMDLPVAELARRARIAFMETRNQMVALAPLVARELQLDSTDYRDVILALRTRQLDDGSAVSIYQERLAAIEDIIRKQKIVSLPARETVIRLATQGESADMPAPTMRPPPLINNQGEMGEFVIPLTLPPSQAGKAALRITDFTYDAATWTTAAHEARPGHELQFAGMVENGVSLARALFAFNSVNVEGWALYAESEMQPYLPLEGQLVALQFRLLRQARAFLDPGLQAGTITTEQARRILKDQVALAPAMVEQEVQRYTYRMPGQATAYFYGYQSLLDLRALTELALGPAFDRQRFHDFILAQGLLTPGQLAETVRVGFIPAELLRSAGGDTQPPQ